MELHPGFRFHPTDEELITHYLSKKVLDSRFSALAIGEVDMNKVEPWELPWKAKWGEKEWYFFCVRDKKYPTGLRTNRATAAGYWKATGKDKEILRGKTLVGMKKTLVFYQGRAPKGVKTNWVIHEYRLQGKSSLDNLPTEPNNDWVISRVFHKTSGGKKVHISALMRTNPSEKELAPSTLPPLVDTSPHMTRIKPEESESRLVPCFSNPIVFPQKSQENTGATRKDAIFDYVSHPIGLQWRPFHGVECESEFFRGHNMVQDQPSFTDLHGINGFGKGQEMVSVSQETAISIGNSSAISNLGMGQQSFEGQEAPPFGPHDSFYTWRY